MPQEGFKKRELTSKERMHLYYVLENKLNGEDLPRGSLTDLQVDLPVRKETLSRIWRKLHQQGLGTHVSVP